MSMPISNALAGVAVSDLERSIDWYRKLLGREPDRRPMANDAEYGFEAGGWMQLFVDKERAGRSSVTLVVDDIDAQIEALRGAGIDAGEPDRSDFADIVIIHDPDSNQIVLAQAKSAENVSAR
jgi:catechol 2,3-dioxygenase-like lactoylglutathione lyase family enzyme